MTNNDDDDPTPRPLRINKRKRQAAGNQIDAATRRRGATLSYPPTFAESGFNRSARAVTMPSLNHDHSSLREGRSTQPLPLTLNNCLGSLHDAVPSPEAHLKYSSNVFGHTAPREFSFRHRILSRVMSSMIGKSSGSHSSPKENSSRRRSAETPADTHVLSQPINIKRSSSSTVDTSSSLYTSLDTALSEFPAPPVTNLTSPTTFSSLERPRSDHQGHRTLCAPSDIAVLRPEITFTPDTDFLDSNTNQNLFVAVEINAVAEATTRIQYERARGLDVAVIIDNSYVSLDNSTEGCLLMLSRPFASPATLMASCETARFIASLLDPLNDRMAIICTSSLSAEYPDRRTIMPLSSANSRRTKSTVDTIATSTDKPDPFAVDEAVRSATALLEQSTPRDQNNALGPFAFGHIFVLTPNSSGISPELLAHGTLQIHLISTGSVPWKGEAKVRCNGWKMQSMQSQELRSVRYPNDGDPSSLLNQLRATIVDARRGALHGAVSNMVLEIKPSQNCAIEGVIGSRNISSIQPGEKVVALIRLKAGLPPAAGYTLAPRRHRDGLTSPYDDPEKEIDKLLGTTPVTILTAKLKYKHSLFPPDTECTLSTKCRIKRQLYSSEWADIPSKPVTRNQATLEPKSRSALRSTLRPTIHHSKQ